jgi:hypothetical protein
MSTINKVLLGLVIFLIIVLIGLIYWQRGGFAPNYWAVYMLNGDIYIGQLSRWPRLSLSNVWFIERNPSNPQSPFNLIPFKSIFLGPEGKLYLNDDNVMWKVRLGAESAILQEIKQRQSNILGQSPMNNQASSLQPPVDLRLEATSTTSTSR